MEEEEELFKEARMSEEETWEEEGVDEGLDMMELVRKCNRNKSGCKNSLREIEKISVCHTHFSHSSIVCVMCELKIFLQRVVIDFELNDC